jgi:hypothetical protein
MAFPINGDLVPTVSGRSNLGVDVGVNGPNAFDITSIRPFNHVHQISGVFHDPFYGGSGVLRFSDPLNCFEVSVDGGLTFNCLTSTANTVSSIGVIGDANLVGDVDLAVPASGFLAIFDTGDASPINFAVDQLGLSGLYDFPTQGFNGRVVNALTDFNGTEAQGVINVVGASGIIADIVGQTLTIATAFGNGVATCFAQTFTASTTWTVTHNFGTEDVQIEVFDSASVPKNVLIPDGIEVTDSNTVTITFNTAQAGQAVIIGCPA